MLLRFYISLGNGCSICQRFHIVMLIGKPDIWLLMACGALHIFEARKCFHLPLALALRKIHGLCHFHSLKMPWLAAINQ